MLDSFVYKNHLGRQFNGLPRGVYLNSNDLRNYTWKYDKLNEKISRLYRPLTKRKIPLIIKCDSDEEAIRAKNDLTELADADVIAMQQGRVYIGDYYTKGYITESKKSNFLNDQKCCNLELTLTSDDPAWYKEKEHFFHSETGSDIGIGSGTDYPYDYPYDYALSTWGRQIVCDSIESNAFQLLIYGAVTNPTVIISGHAYTINGTVGAGERLLIDSLTKTITLITAAGNRVNYFDKRDRKSYIFEPVPAGMNTVSWNGEFTFNLTVIEKRSEPKWT